MAGVYDAVDADFRRLLLAALPRNPSASVLDVGCDDGSWTDRVRQAVGVAPHRVAGIEIVGGRCRLAAARGFDARETDIDAEWPFDDGSFDIVHANQVIEHVLDLDHFVSETKRVLRAGATAVVGTENLASWHNVAALVLGFMPFSLTNVSSRGPIGNPLAIHSGRPQQRGASWQHVHVLTTKGLRSLFEAHGLRVVRVVAAGYYPLVGRAAAALASRDPRHAHFIGVVAEKPISHHPSAGAPQSAFAGRDAAPLEVVDDQAGRRDIRQRRSAPESLRRTEEVVNHLVVEP
jgi:SAM-dependent methyltransferase